MKKLLDACHTEEWDSPFGRIAVSCSGKGIRAVSLVAAMNTRQKRNSSRGGRRPSNRRETGSAARRVPAGFENGRGAALARRAIVELQEYARGGRKRFTVPLDLQGTAFQLKVWNALLRIPYGETRSYRDIAREIGNRRASRAVGTANGSNPVAIIVPCHRVIASDGSLGGYGGGLERKVQMLRLEKSWPA